MDCREAIMSEEYADFIEEFYQPTYIPNSGELSEFCITFITPNNIAYYVKIGTVPEINYVNYRYTVFPKCYGLMDTTALEASNILTVRNQPVLNLRGEGVIVGIIDTGIDYLNNIFKNSDGTTRILSIWDQTINTGNTPREIPYGSEYTKDMIDEALSSEDPYSIVPSKDDLGHGTIMASIAAGNVDDANNFSGAAPRAMICVVKLKQAKRYLKEFYRIRNDAIAFQENDLMFGVKYLSQIAQQYNMPLVVCIGVGTSMGAHIGQNQLSRLLSRLAQNQKRAVVAAMGNEANSRHHYYGAGTPDLEYDDIEIRVGENSNGFMMELWGQPEDTYSVAFTSPAGESVPRIPVRIGESALYNFVFERTSITVDYINDFASEGRQLISMKFSAPTQGIWRLRVYYTSVISGIYNIWMPISEFMNADNYFLRSNPEITLTSPASASTIIAVAAYNDENNSIYTNSGRGYNASREIRPDIAAPGVNVYSGLINNRFGYVTGTSVSSAITAGAVAMILEWAIVRENMPYLNSEGIKAYLIRGANRRNSITYPNREWGYGELDLYGVFNALTIQ